MISKNLLNAYKSTTYLVPKLQLKIRVEEPNSQLEKVLEDYNSSSWAFITAWNPESNQLEKETNLALNKQLEKDLNGYQIFAGYGIPDSKVWEPEESFFILGITRDKAIQLAEKYDQNAFLFGQLKETPSLILTHFEF